MGARAGTRKYSPQPAVVMRSAQLSASVEGALFSSRAFLDGNPPVRSAHCTPALHGGIWGRGWGPGGEQWATATASLGHVAGVCGKSPGGRRPATKSARDISHASLCWSILGKSTLGPWWCVCVVCCVLCVCVYVCMCVCRGYRNYPRRFGQPKM